MNKTPIQLLVALVKIWDADQDAPGYGSPHHGHQVPGLWDGDNRRPKGSVCEECEIHDGIRQIVREHLAGNPEWEPPSKVEVPHEGRAAFDEWFAKRGVVPRLTYLEVFEAGQAASPAVVTLTPTAYIVALKARIPPPRPLGSPMGTMLDRATRAGNVGGWNDYRRELLKVLDGSITGGVDYRFCDGDVDD